MKKTRKKTEIKTESINIRVTANFKEIIEEAASDDGRSTSNFVERIIEKYLALGVDKK